ncbi:hypothetical protein COCSUDRAFT_42571 [Coccomyxa subellipsoidea C-169]|uniref:Glycosyltransferase 2-like domain-containing protein n=1 Tax=Coccomyxa subellipsoidea (strain C-169) TaxID=574566 RepID=I0YUY3_COCSC|nr:hypothetical protein COCSUDRAFT_42571 [Coccomyxa subellipsoidea C-169]EIE22202.1 hypothetical protein COCSUDRAFT_42571 [Coccomyxa subellipsoidea C-169]|eukprot:XP_005646746.1 hypothetical protein COCSUDRAFT_42571 [Coccomyxa subellipsoidea C-169]
MKLRETFPAGYHDMRDVAKSLERRDHQVEVKSVNIPGTDWRALVTEDDLVTPKYDAILASGISAHTVADWAARVDTPVVRFFPDSQNATDSTFEVHRERPSILVFANATDAERFPYLEDVERLVLPLARVKTKLAPAYAALETALEKALTNSERTTPRNTLQVSEEACGSKGGEDGGEEREEGGSCPAAAPAWAWPTAASGEPPLLGLVMILKNENATIAATLESVKHDIDYWTIVDTGSTDGTQDTISKIMADVPGQLLSEPFVDFSTTRNYALKAHGQKTAYAFMLDADFAVVDAWRLRNMAHRMVTECRERSIPECMKGVKVWFKMGDMGFFSNRVFPTPGLGLPGGWLYKYPVHEVPGHSGLEYLNVGRIDDVIQIRDVIIEALPITHSKSSERWKNLDLPLLTKEHEKHPEDTRIVFYLGQTYQLIGETEQALATYQKRIDMRGWLQEVFESHLRRAKMMMRLLAADPGMDPANDTSVDPVPDLLAALALYPKRAEPLMQLSRHSEWMRDKWCHRDVDPVVCRMQQQVSAFDYAHQAAEMPFPGGDTLFADISVYEYEAKEQLAITAWYVAKDFSDAYDVGLDAAHKLLKKFPDDEQKKANVEWYEKLKDSLV